jgi:hypothetical protein
MPVWIFVRQIFLSQVRLVPGAFKIITKKTAKAIQNRFGADNRIVPQWPYFSSIRK